MNTAQRDDQPTPADFETAIKELEAIVQALEAGNGPLEESLAAYERGMHLIKHCQQILDAAEQRVRVLEAGELREFSLAEDEGGGADD
ncbi:MAG: exodeoxyribonuclease VII small subunit [Rhodocyclaceae bacterium]|nr:exodeoxyribonuclease VII small subunit [Rhodocyclaceae bacterium]